MCIISFFHYVQLFPHLPPSLTIRNALSEHQPPVPTNGKGPRPSKTNQEGREGIGNLGFDRLKGECQRTGRGEGKKVKVDRK